MRSAGTRRAGGTASTMSRPWITQCVSAPSIPPPGGCHAVQHFGAQARQERGDGQRSVLCRHRVRQRVKSPPAASNSAMKSGP